LRTALGAFLFHGDDVLKKTRVLSGGERNRLALAKILVQRANFLILDEPTNGLDPAGIQEMRHFIRELVDKHGKTVFLSSHMLNEVEQVCDRVAIIRKGEIIREGAVADLVQEGSRVRIHATPYDHAVEVVRQQWTVIADTQQANGKVAHAKPAFTVEAGQDDVPQIINTLVRNDISIYEVIREKQSLEQVFLDITQDAQAHTMGATEAAKQDVMEGIA